MKFYIQPPYSEREYDQKALTLLYEKHKYMIMWKLRHLEKEIAEEGGLLLLTNNDGNPRLETKDFTPDLTEKIHRALADPE